MAGVDPLLTARTVAAVSHKARHYRLHLGQVYLKLFMAGLVLKRPTTVGTGFQGHFQGLLDGVLRWFLSVAKGALAWATPWGLGLGLPSVTGKGGRLPVASA